VSDDVFAQDGHERVDHVAIASKPIHEIGLQAGREGLFFDGPYANAVGSRLDPDLHLRSTG
jgi:hypothetical protein